VALQPHIYTLKHTRTMLVYVMLATIIYIGGKTMPFSTYIDDKDMIPILLEHDWIIWKDTWTDCSYETYMALKKMMRHTGNAKILIS